MSSFRHLLQNALHEGRKLAAGPIARASGLSMAIRLSGMGLLFVQAVLTARLLGPAGYGTTATVLSAAQVLSSAAMLGFGALAVREVPARRTAEQPGALAAFLRHSFIATLAVSVVVALAASLALVPAVPVAEAMRHPFALGGILVVPLAFVALFRGWAQGFGQIAMAQVPGEFLRPAVMVSVLVTVAIGGLAFDPAEYLIAATVAALVAAVVAWVWIARKELRHLPAPGDWVGGRAIMAASFPFLGMGMIAILQGELNTLLLAALAGPRETGLFQPVARLMPLLALPIQAASMRYAPRMAEFWQRGEHGRILSVTGTFTWTTTLLTLLAGLAIAGAGPWLMLVFGRDFGASAPLLWIVAAAQVFNAACGPLGVVFSMAGRTGIAVFGQLAGLAVNIAVGVLFIPRYGAAAAAMGILAATVTWNVVLLIAIRRILGIDTSILGVLARLRSAR
ncbi:lipopolysaccharide biosynthesis protein [Tsuneonella suprasediminis]|uniref:lipopolysaccharide biosynthesis protein n=1 Tax=Tsuneonella suprasediminis TaxID=2306996 RepID=UPI002F950FEC